MPTFNDLYYTNIGSISLRPEVEIRGVDISAHATADLHVCPYNGAVSKALVIAGLTRNPLITVNNC
jgi:hypothetical protein